MKKFLPEISLFMLLAFLNLVAGCSNYYRVRAVDTANSQSALQAPSYKYVILHQGNEAWHFTGLSLDSEKQELTGTLEKLAPDHLHYTTTRPEGANRYKKSLGDPAVEVHLYTSEYAKLSADSVMVPLASLQKIELYEPDKGATAASYIMGGVGIAIGVFALLIVIIALTKSSCPLVYINQGADHRFVGEMFGGAVNSSSERDDYMPLPGLKSYNGSYEIQISNELLERQYTDLAELLVADHSASATALTDRHGNVYAMSALQPPAAARAGNGVDYSNALMATDSLQYLFNESNTAAPETSSLLMQFEKPAGAKDAALMLHVKNSFWLDYIFGKFNEQFGTHFDAFSKKQKKASPESNLQWSLDQGIPLSVYIETPAGWQFVDYVSTVGPLAGRDVAVPVDVSAVAGKQVNIKLECGFDFWEIDCAAMDFSVTKNLKASRVSLLKATDEKGKDIRKKLLQADKKYLYQPAPGTVATLTFPAPAPAAGYVQTVFLHSRGYYEYIRHYTGKPDIAYLKSFRQKGAFARFSKTHYDRFVNDRNFIINALTSNDAK